MKINEICKRTGLTERTIRFYIEKGLLETQSLVKNGRVTREFSEKEVNILIDISKLRRAGFTIQDILEMQRSEKNVQTLISKQCKELEQENWFRNEVLMELKRAEKRGEMSWRKLASILFDDKKKHENDIICYPIDEVEAPISEEKHRWFVVRMIAITMIILTVLGACWQGVRLNRVKTTTFLLGNVIVEDKWYGNDGIKYISIYTPLQYDGNGIEQFFKVPKVVKIESEDYYNSFRVKETTYQSFNIWIEIPYGDAIYYGLLDKQENIMIDKVLSDYEFVKEYCTVRVVMTE